jgi:hypothetical protein
VHMVRTGQDSQCLVRPLVVFRCRVGSASLRYLISSLLLHLI